MDQEHDKLEEILKKAKPDSIELPENKAELRRELLNSEYYVKKTFWERFLSFKFALRALAIVIVCIVLLITDFTPREISAKDIVNKLDDVYSKSIVPGKVNYSEGTCTVYGENDQNVNFKFENWRDPVDGKIKFIRKDLNTDEILDFKILDGSEIYTSPDSKIKIVKIQTIDDLDGKLNSGIGQDQTTKLFTNESRSRQSYLIKLDSDSHIRKSITLTITDGKNDCQVNDCSAQQKIFIYTSFIDVDKMNMETPAEIASRLKTQPNIMFLGSEFDEKIGKKVLLLQKGRTIDSLGNSRINIRIEKRSVTSNDRMFNSTQLYTTNGNIQTQDEKPFSKIEERETIKINSETGKIYQMKITIIRDGKEENISELTFQDDKYIDYDKNIFDKKIEKVIVFQNDKKK